MARIRVLHLMSNLSLKSGVASVIVNYCKHMDLSRFDISIVYFDEVDTETYIEELNQLKINTYLLKRSGFTHNWKMFCEEHYGEYDILHNHQTFLAPIMMRAKSMLGIKVLLSHAHVTKFSDTFIKSVRNGILSYPCRFVSDKLLACSQDAGVALFGNRFLSNGVIMKNAIDLEKFAFDEDERNRVRLELGLNDCFVVGHVGNMTPQKNHMFILDIFDELKKRRANVKLILVGDGYLRSDIINRIAELGLSNDVLLLGVRNDVNSLMNAMDVFLFPSLFEGLGIVLIEAQENGLKCIYSDQVPTEADVSCMNNSRISLNADKVFWAQEICKADSRVDNYLSIRAAGYEINHAARSLERLYISLVK